MVVRVCVCVCVCVCVVVTSNMILTARDHLCMYRAHLMTL
jgi:hypothetical protein